MKAPLLIGCDVRNMDNDTIEILQNKDIIAVNQDPLGIQGHIVWRHGKTYEIWACDLVGGKEAVILFNRWGKDPDTMTLYFNMIGFTWGTTLEIYDLWNHKSLGTFTGVFVGENIPAQGNMMLRVTPIL